MEQDILPYVYVRGELARGNLLGWSPGDWQFGKSLCILPVLFAHARFATGDGWLFDSRCLFGGNSSLRNRLHGVEPWDIRLSVMVPYDAAVFNKGRTSDLYVMALVSRGQPQGFLCRKTFVLLAFLHAFKPHRSIYFRSIGNNTHCYIGPDPKGWGPILPYQSTPHHFYVHQRIQDSSNAIWREIFLPRYFPQTLTNK